MSMMIDAMGWVAMAGLLGAYGLLTTGRLRATGLVYQVTNLLGGALLLVNTAYHGAWPSAALNAAWFVIGAAGVRQGLLAGRSGALGTTRAEHPDT